MTKKGIFRSLIIAAILSVPAIWLYSFAPNFHDQLYVPTIPLEELRGLNEAKVREEMNKSGGIRPISGIEKTLYLIKATPSTYVIRVVVFFGFLFVAALLGARNSERSSNET